MSEDLQIRTGTPQDVDAVMHLCLLACSENGFLNPDPAKLLGEVWPALNRERGLIGLIEGDGVLEGGVLLRIGEMWYSTDKVLEERAIFIHPDYRSAKGGRARRLCEFSKRAADGLGLPLIIGVLSNHRTEAKMRLYERQFGKPAGAFFLHNARTGEWQSEAA